MKNTEEFVYVRTKNAYTNDDGYLELFLFVGITRNSFVPIDDDEEFSCIKHVNSIFSKVIEMPLFEAPKAFTGMKNHDFRIVISEHEKQYLMSLAKSNFEAFVRYKYGSR